MAMKGHFHMKHERFSSCMDDAFRVWDRFCDAFSRGFTKRCSVAMLFFGRDPWPCLLGLGLYFIFVDRV